MHKILFIIPYFGKWPVWFPAFLKSCKFNHTINWLFLTDCDIPNSSISNVEFIPFTLQDFNSIATSKLGFEVKITHPYKLCDFRPTYGIIFDNYLENYDFWGHCDIDVIFGDIRKFIVSEILSEYEIVSAQKERICGHFTLYKNNEKIANLFTNDPNYQFFFNLEICSAFDEAGMTEIVKILAARGEIKVYWSNWLANFANPGSNGATAYLGPNTNRWYWEKGKLHNRTDEIMYMHFMNWKKSLKVCNVDYSDRVKSFYISYSHIGLSKYDKPSLALRVSSLSAWNREFWPRRIEDLRREIKAQGMLPSLKKLTKLFISTAILGR